MPRSVIIAGSRTPIGKFSGSLSPLSAQELGGIAIKGALERAGVAPEQVDLVLMGQVIQAGQGQVYARQGGHTLERQLDDQQQGLPVQSAGDPHG